MPGKAAPLEKLSIHRGDQFSSDEEFENIHSGLLFLLLVKE